MATKANPSDLESQGFRLTSNKTVAKGGNSWVDEKGRVHYKQVFVNGSPNNVKKMLSATKPGEVTELEYAHNIKTFDRWNVRATPGGVLKEHEVVEEQGDHLGDGGCPTEQNVGCMRSTPEYSSHSDSEPEKKPEGLSVLQVLKNMIDNLESKTNGMTYWIIAIGVIAALALGMAIALM